MLKLFTQKIYGFYHVCLANNWKQIVDEQISLIIRTRLYQKTNKIFVSCVGPNDAKNKLRKMLPEKFKIVFYDANIKLAEVPMIHHMQTLSQDDDFLIWYIHTKGVFSGSPNVTTWRRMMEHFVIKKHAKCIEAVSSPKCDMCGSLVYDAFTGPPVTCTAKEGHFFAGNFWWSKSSYIRKTPSVLTGKDRWVAEFIFSRVRWTRFYSFYQKHIHRITDLYDQPMIVKDYIHNNTAIRIPCIPRPRFL